MDINPAQFEILRAAVTIARFENVEKVARLRMLLQRRFLDQNDDIDHALRYCGAHEAKNRELANARTSPN